MGNKSKKDQISQIHVTDYERSKLLRVRENQERLRELGIKNIAKSLSSLVESAKTKKKKLKAVDSIERNVDIDMDSEDEYREVAASKVPQKKHRPQYIANLSKQRRVSTPNSSPMFPLNTKETKNRTHADTNVAKAKQSRASVTMAELILSKKGSKNGLCKQNLGKPKSFTSGARRKLVLVDNDDDTEEEDSSQGTFFAL